MARPRRVRGLAPLLAMEACVVLAWVGALAGSSVFVTTVHPVHRGDRSARHAAGLDTSALEEIMKDPEKLKQMQEDAAKIMANPEQRKALESWSEKMQSGVAKLKEDPEMKEFFEDIEKNGMDAMKKYEKDERILRKFSMATGGPDSIPGMMGMPGMGGMGGMGAPPAAPPAYKPGDEVIINGLQKAPELNGKKAMIVPPTADERKTLEGTDRVIVRLMDTGDQFAVKPSNLRTTAQEADELMSSNLEDISMYNPALQSEAAKLRESGKLDELANDPELQPVFDDIKKNGMGALEKYWSDDKLMKKISKAMGTS